MEFANNGSLFPLHRIAIRRGESLKMKPDLMAVSCPDCGERQRSTFGQLKRNANLTMTCGKCGLVHLAFNAASMAIYWHAKERGLTNREAPKPLRLEPIVVLPSKDGTELVMRRLKNGKESVYTRRAKRSRRPPE
jgi:hypothetical protein